MVHPHTPRDDTRTPLERAEDRIDSLERLLESARQDAQAHATEAAQLRFDLVLARNQITRLQRELDALAADGITWTRAAELIREVMLEVIADPECTRRQIKAALDGLLVEVRRRGLR